MAADALSSSMSEQDSEISCTGLTIVIPLWLDAVKTAMKDSPYYQQLKQKLDQKSISEIHYKEVNGVWYYKGRILLEPNSDLCHRVLMEHHATPAGGHSGYQHTLQKNQTIILVVGNEILCEETSKRMSFLPKK